MINLIIKGSVIFMATSKSYRDFILEKLKVVTNISFRPMMGEYLLYLNDVLFGGIYDDRLLIKKTKSNAKYGLSEEEPYENAKKMLLINNVDGELLKEIVLVTYNDLLKNSVRR